MGMFDAVKSGLGSAINLNVSSGLKGLSSKLDIGSILSGNTAHSATSSSSGSNGNSDVTVIDKDWITNRFMTPSNKLPNHIAKNRFHTSTVRKHTDTTLGGNTAVNARPQYTPYADVVHGKEYSPTTNVADIGMSRVYSEYIDDFQQTVFLTFGLPKFNGLLEFFTRAVDYEDSVLANTGRSPFGYVAGQFIGGAVMLAAFPLITITVWVAKTISKLLLGNNPFNYYYLEPNMSLYWSTVNNVVTTLATELGILAPEFMPSDSIKKRIGVPVKFDKDDMEAIAALMPGIIDKDTNYIDVFKIATRAQSIANGQMIREKEKYDANSVNSNNYDGFIKAQNTLPSSNVPGSTFGNSVNYYTSFQTYLNKIKDSGLFSDKKTSGNDIQSDGTITKAVSDDTGKVKDTRLIKTNSGDYEIDLADQESRLTSAVKAFDSTLRDGALYAIFAVDYIGTVSESFSNSTSPIGLGSTINQIGGASRDAKFNIAGGNITDTLGKAAGYVKDVAAGMLNSITFGMDAVIQTMTGGGFIDLPDKWENSDTSFPNITYKMELRSSSADVISQLQNIYIPLAMILSGTLPLATGKASYTSPLLCNLFCKGVQKIDLGIITSLSITRGVGNLGFNRQWKTLAIDVTFTVKDLSSLMAAPVNSSVFDIFKVAMDDHSVLSRYLATIASRDIYTDKYALKKVKLKASRILMKKDQMLSPSAWGLRTGENMNWVMGGVVADHTLSLRDSN